MDENRDNSKISTGVDFAENEKIKIIDGPFSNFIGIVSEVHKSTSGETRLKVFTKLFSNSTSVIVSEFQVEKIDQATVEEDEDDEIEILEEEA